MKSNKTVFAMLLVAMFTLFSFSTSFAQDSMKKDDDMKKDAMMKEVDKRPIVAVIAADWCPYCKRVDPVLAEVRPGYSEKLNFVVFDVTNETTKAASKAKAKELGLSEFYNEFKGKTSTVAVLKDQKVVYKTSNNAKKADYIKAFDEALN